MPVYILSTSTTISTSSVNEDPDEVTGGYDALPELASGTTTISLGTGVLRLTFWTPRTAKPVTKFAFYSGGTAFTGTITLVRAALYELVGTDLTLRAATANVASTGATVDGVATPALSAAPPKEYVAPMSNGGGLPTTYTPTAGVRYACGLLQVGGSTGTMRGNIRSGADGLGRINRAPLIGAQHSNTSLADLPATIVAASIQSKTQALQCSLLA